MMVEAESPARRRRKEARPHELLEAALDLFVEKGFAATRAEEVAQRAGVSKGTLYLYYPSKEELLKAVIREHLGSRIAAGEAAVDQHAGTSAELLREVYSHWWQAVLASPSSGAFKLIVAEVRNFPELAQFYQREVIEPGERLIGRIVQRGIDSGEFEPVNVTAAVHSLVLPMVMLCLHKHSLGACVPMLEAFDPIAFVRQHIDLVLHGLARKSVPSRARARA
ncbi:MAG: TetR/AcrR family transcriptional regulator [Burkholderiaceae bacterium]